MLCFCLFHTSPLNCTVLLLFVCCAVCLYVVLFPLWATELSTQHVNNKKWIKLNNYYHHHYRHQNLLCTGGHVSTFAHNKFRPHLQIYLHQLDLLNVCCKSDPSFMKNPVHNIGSRKEWTRLVLVHVSYPHPHIVPLTSIKMSNDPSKRTQTRNYVHNVLDNRASSLER
jgi:hypothetical protein